MDKVDCLNDACSSQAVTSPSDMVISVDMENNTKHGPLNVKQIERDKQPKTSNVILDSVDVDNISKLASTVSPKVLRKSYSFHSTAQICQSVDNGTQNGNGFITFSDQRVVLKTSRSQSLQHNFEINKKNKKSTVCPVGSPRMTRSNSAFPKASPRHECAFSRHVSTPNLSQSKPSKVRFAVPVVTNSSRFYCRRNALCDPEKMIMPQDTREKIQSDVARRKTSVTRKISNFLVTRLGLERDEDLL